MEPARRSVDVEAIEYLVKNDGFRTKLTRYFQNSLKLNGKRDGGAIFRVVIRKLIDPIALSDYSWKGQKKPKSETTYVSFESGFPSLINFVNSIVCLGDSEHVLEKTEELFKGFLKNKCTEAKRNAGRTSKNRIGSTRKHKMKQSQNGASTSGEPIAKKTNNQGDGTDKSQPNGSESAKNNPGDGTDKSQPNGSGSAETNPGDGTDHSDKTQKTNDNFCRVSL